MSIRRISLLWIPILFLLIGFLAAALPSGTAHGSSPRGFLKVSISTKSQKSLLESGLKLKVRSSVSGPVRVRATGGSAGLLRTRSVKFSSPGRKSLSLALTSRGRKVLANCGALSASVAARGPRGSRAGSTRRLVALSTGCFVKVPVGPNPDRCDFLDPSECLYPFANDYFTKLDQSTVTGRRLDLKPASTPKNTLGKNIDVTDMNRGDGFSPGNMIVLKIPGLDTPAAFENSGLVPITDTAAYADPEQSVVVIDATTGERHPIWAELDSNPTTVDPSDDGPGGINANPENTEEVNLIVRPAKNFEYGHRYIVAFRNLKDADNKAIPAPIGFRAYRDRLKTRQAVVEARREHMNSVISDVVTKGGIDRRSLYMAWDFTVASQESITGRALQIRDDAFSRLGDTNLANRLVEGDSPDFEVTGYCDRDKVDGGPNCGGGAFQPDPGDDYSRVIEGRLTGVPCYLNRNGCNPGAVFDFKPNGDVDFNPTYTMNVPFRCFIPDTIQPGGEGSPVAPGAAGIYGHGLLGDYRQITSAGPVNVGRDAGSVWCGANWDGFSSTDFVTIIDSLKDMSNFNKAVDRMQQGFVNFMLIGRAMIHEDGFSSSPAFQLDEEAGPGEDLKSAIDTSGGAGTRLQYMGISQGGIMGGALMALSPDSDYGVLGVPGMNYSTLLRRSVDSDTYFKNDAFGLYKFYPNFRERPLILSLMQLLWDRGEPNGYAQAMTDEPLPDTPPHNVLLRVAFGDHQVANVTAEVEARTIGASIYSPALNSGRHWEAEPFSGLSLSTSFPTSGGSMLVYYDSGPPSWFGPNGQGIATPPIENVPPREEWGFGGDPHEHPRRSLDGVRHAVTFLENGVIESCETITPVPSGDAHCYANGWTGPPPP
jgi:hypothetical protein